MRGISGHLSVRRFVLSSSALMSIALAVAPTAAFADCLPDVSGLFITCQNASPNGYVAGTTFPGTPVNGVTITVNTGATVGTGAGPSPLLSAGTTSVVNNQGAISDLVTNTAISLGGGSTVTNAASATGGITGIISLGSTTSSQTNIVNNYAAAGITGDIDSTGNTTINNTSTITGNINLGAGNDTIINTGTITGNIEMGSGINNFSASSAAQLPTGTLDATADTLGNNTLTLTGTTAEIFSKTVTNFDYLEKTGTGSWSINAPITLTNEIDVTSGTLLTNNASNLGANKIVISGGALLEFTNANTGTYSGAASGTGAVQIDSGAGVTTFSGTNSYTGGTTINGALSVTGGAALADNGLVTMGATGILNVLTTETIGDLTGAAGAAIHLTGDLIESGAGTTTFAGNIDGAGGLQHTGSGSLTLSGTNTFAGPATVNNGTLILSGGNAIGNTTQVIVNKTATTAGTLQVNTAEVIGSLAGNGGSVVLNAGLTTGGDNTSTEYDGVISGVGALTKAGTGTFILTGANTYTGGTTINAGGTLQIGNGGTIGSIVGNVTDNGNLAFDHSDSITPPGVISGTGTVTQIGTGNLSLNVANTYSGGTFVNAGTLTLGDNAGAGTGSIALANGTTLAAGVTGLTVANAIALTGASTIDSGTGTFTLSGVISGTGSFTKVDTGTLVLTGANTYSGGTTVTAGTLQGSTTSLQGNITDNAAVVFSQAGAGTYAGNLTGTGSLTVTGGGNVTLSGANIYSGTTTVAGGSTLTTGAAGTGIGDSSDVTVGAGSTLAITTTETIGSLAGSGNVTIGTSLTTGGNNHSTTFSGPITGADLIKVGTGTMTLTGASTLTQLDVNGGTLDIGATTGSVNTGAGNANVGAAGTLTVDGGLTTTTLNVASGGSANVDVGGTVTGAVSNSGTTVVNGNVLGNVTNNASGLLKGAGTITGTVTNAGNINPGNSPGIINIVGSYTQTGTYTAELTASAVAGTGYDQIKVTGAPGTAGLAGTLALMPATGLYVAGSKYDIVDAAGGITGNFATITGNVVSPFLSFTPTGGTGIVNGVGTEQFYELTVTRTTYAVGMGAGATPNQIAVANGFQNLVAGATGDAQTVVVAVDNMTAAQAQSFFDQASPEAYGAYATALQDQSELFTRQVGLHLHEGNDNNGTVFWGRGYYGTGTGSHQSYRFGSNGDIGGGAFGLDIGSGDFVFGAAGGWSEDQIKYGLGNSKGHSNSWQVGGYAGYTAGNVDADLQLAYSEGSFGVNKSIVVATIDRATMASFNGDLFKAVGTVGYNASLADMSIRPFIGVDFDSGNTKAFTETGAGALDLTVGKINVDKTNLMLGIDLIPSLTGLSPYGSLTYLYDVDNKARNISAFFNGNAASAFTVSGVKPDQSEFDIDAGLAYATSANMSLYVGYQGAYRSDLNRNGVSAGLKINF